VPMASRTFSLKWTPWIVRLARLTFTRWFGWSIVSILSPLARKGHARSLEATPLGVGEHASVTTPRAPGGGMPGPGRRQDAGRGGAADVTSRNYLYRLHSCADARGSTSRIVSSSWSFARNRLTRNRRRLP